MNRPHALPLLVAAAALSAGCGGPDRPLRVGFKEVPSNVVLGAQSSPSPAPPTPTQMTGPSTVDVPLVALPPPPSVVTLPPPPFEVPDPSRPVAPPMPAPSGPACPVADPLQAPAVEAPSTITARPAKAQYIFRNAGTFVVSGADARSGTFPLTSLRTVSGAVEGPTGFAFDVAETLGDLTTTTGYAVVERQPLPTDLEPGLYLVRVQSARGSQSSDFDPTPELQLAAFPLVRGASVESRGVDPTTATAMSFVATVTGKVRVDACGTPLDSFTLELTEGQLISPTQDLTFESTYAVGTQYGGLLLRDTVDFKGTDGDAGVSRTKTSTISQVPQAATGPQP